MQTNELTPEMLAQFTAQFGDLHDAVVHTIAMTVFNPKPGQTHDITVTLGAFRVDTGNWGHDWVNLVMRFEDVTYFDLSASEKYSFGIISETIVDFFEGHVCVDFDPYCDKHHDFHDLPRPEGMEGPMFIIVCRRCFWHTEPYKEARP